MAKQAGDCRTISRCALSNSHPGRVRGSPEKLLEETQLVIGVFLKVSRVLAFALNAYFSALSQLEKTLTPNAVVSRYAKVIGAVPGRR